MLDLDDQLALILLTVYCSLIYAVCWIQRTYYRSSSALWVGLPLLTLGSLLWEAGYLYFQHRAEQEAAILKGLPISCFHGDGWFKWLFSWASSSDDCVEYHKKINHSPLWRLNPVVVATSLASRIADILVRGGFATFGKSLGDFMAEVLKITPVQYQTLVFLFLLLFLLCSLVLVCGYTVHIPFVLTLSPNTKQRSTAMPVELNFYWKQKGVKQNGVKPKNSAKSLAPDEVPRKAIKAPKVNGKKRIPVKDGDWLPGHKAIKAPKVNGKNGIPVKDGDRLPGHKQ